MRAIYIVIVVGLIIIGIYFVTLVSKQDVLQKPSTEKTPVNVLNNNITKKSSFSSDFTVNAAPTLNKSKNLDWWLGSGAYFYARTGYGSTVIGSLDENDHYRIAYLKSNPVDTDNGYHPQNIFRLVNILNKWKDFSASVYYKIVNDNLSSSPNRNASNGLLLMLRYTDSNNLYYAGYRVDGTYVVKKKKDGKYSTLSQVKINKENTILYNVQNKPNLLPHNEWLGLRVEVKNLENGAVNIKVYSDIGRKGNWLEVINTIDDGIMHGPAFVDEGYVGIRTDFMDVKFDDFAVNSL